MRGLLLRSKIISSLTIFLSLIILPLTSHAAIQKKLTIFAEPNLATPLIEIARIYSKKTASIVSVEYGSSKDMINRIEDGESSDLFISSHKDWHDELKLKGLIDIYNVNHFINDQFVIVTSTANKKLPAEFSDKDITFDNALNILSKNRLDLIIDNSNTSLGQHSKGIIDPAKYKDIKIFKKLPEDISTAEDIINKNPNIFALMLNSQIHDNKNFQIIAKTQKIAVFYQSLVIAGENMDNSRQFSNFLNDKEVQKIFIDNGFIKK